MGQRDLAGPGHDAAADEAGIGDGVMGGAEGPLRDQAGRRIQHAGYGVNLGGLQCLLEGKRGQDGGQALGQHGLSRSRRADHEDVVAAGRGHFQSALSRLLPAHVLEVHGKVLQFAEQRLGRDAVGLALDDADNRAVEQFKNIKQRGDGVDVDAFYHGGFSGVGRGKNQVGNIFFTRQNGHRQHARHGAHAAVQPQFADQ